MRRITLNEILIKKAVLEKSRQLYIFTKILKIRVIFIKQESTYLHNRNRKLIHKILYLRLVGWLHGLNVRIELRN